MITTKILKNNEIEDACALLHEVYIEQMNWIFAEDNPSKLKIESRNHRLILTDRFTNIATWFGAFNGSQLVGCVRLCGVDDNGKLEIEGYPTSQLVTEYLVDKGPGVRELTKAAVKDEYKEQKVIHRLFLTAFKYCEKNKYSIIGCTHNGFLKTLFKRIGYPLKIEQAFRYEPHDPLPVNFYFADYSKSEIRPIIAELETLVGDLSPTRTDIFRSLELVAPILPLPVYWHDVNGIVLGVNEHCLKAMGAARAEDIIGRIPYDFYPKEIAEHILSHNEKVMRSGEIMSQEETVEDITTGEIRYYSSIKAPLYDDDGSVIGIIGSSLEITAEKEAVRLQSENEAYRAKQELQDGISECLETIMHTIGSYQRDNLNKAVYRKTGTNPSVKHVDEDISLTNRERKVLNLLSLNKSPKEIATYFSIFEDKSVAPATINSIINKQLYPKFAVGNLSQLIEKANVLNLIPFTAY